MMIFLGIVLFLLLVVAHEYGHFLVAKRNGVEVEEFGIGFPPRLVGKKLGKGIFEAYYSINLLPLGGFVRLKGENDADRQEGSFGVAHLRAKARIILAGVGMNFLVAVLIFFVLALFGLPQLVEGQFSIGSDKKITTDDVIAAVIEQQSPAGRAGLKQGDVLVSIAGRQVHTADDVFELPKEFAGKEVDIELIREGAMQKVSVTLPNGVFDSFTGITFDPDGGFPVLVTAVAEGSPAADAGVQVGDRVQLGTEGLPGAANLVYGQGDVNDFLRQVNESVGQSVEIAMHRLDESSVATVQTATIQVNEEGYHGRLGIGPFHKQAYRSTWSAPLVAIGTAMQLAWLTLAGLGGLVANLFTGNFSEATSTVSGPVGIVAILGDISLIGFNYLLFFIGIISLTLAVMNALPIPALDGGRLFVTLLFRALKKPLTPKTEQAIHGTGMALLLLMVFLVTIVDVRRFF